MPIQFLTGLKKVVCYNGMSFSGVPRTTNRCPVALWLLEGGFDNVSVGNGVIQARKDSETLYLQTPPAAARFILWFDDLFGPTPEGAD